MSGFRVGFGYDVHQLAEGRKFVLGGIEIPFGKGPLAHSDGDVLIHAICDALLGAAGLGDIGLHFPDTSSDFKDIDSKVLLAKVRKLIEARGYSIGNIDSTVSLERPKLRPHIDTMREVLATILGMETSALSIKATTTEKLGFVGREEGIAAQAVVLITSL
ncbi:MAG: 2-C-methyl-D-erythritol 2,4-cyclodiphosphate synthase [Bacteroidales bacterium]|nr:2-C-methyl-D-erythritol 2,4-cyclodiphosphate synthase [Bacteroidales bacterium]